MLKLDTGGRLDKGLGRGSRPPEEVRFAIDSALEGTGFELLVPLADVDRSEPKSRNVSLRRLPRPRIPSDQSGSP